MNTLTISEAGRRSGVPPKTIRYYESVGLIPEAARTDGGYRTYGESEVAELRFIQRARGLGFTVEEVRTLLGLWRDRSRASADVKRLAARHVADIERRIAELETMRDTLLDLMHRCHGDERPDCPILDELAGAGRA